MPTPYQRLDFDTEFEIKPVKKGANTKVIVCVIVAAVIFILAGGAVGFFVFVKRNDTHLNEPLPTAVCETEKQHSDLLKLAECALKHYPLVDLHNDWAGALRSFWLEEVQKTMSPTDPMLHLDDLRSVAPEINTDFNRLERGFVRAAFLSVWVDCEPLRYATRRVLQQIDIVKRMAEYFPDRMMIATSSQDVETARAKGLFAGFIGMEGGHVIHSNIGVLRQLYELGARYMTLTHNCNVYWAQASSSEGVENYQGRFENVTGLTSLGVTVVKEMNRLGMLVDISHVSAQTMKDVLKVTQAPVIFSHSNARAICNVSRNVPDDVLQLLKKNGGMIAVTFYSPFVTEAAHDFEAEYGSNCDNSTYAFHPCGIDTYRQFVAQALARQPPLSTVDSVAKHVKYIGELIGYEHVGFGSDFDGSGNFLPVGLDDVQNYPVLVKSLLSEGVPFQSLEGILGGK